MLLPRPQVVEPLPGVFELGEGPRIGLPNDLEPPERRAIEAFQAECGATGGSESARIAVRVETVPGQSSREAQGYRLRIEPDGVELVGRSGHGLHHGIQTLRGLLAEHGRRWPCMVIDDRPDFAVRGLLYDVSRGRVPTLDTLKQLADRLERLKINQLQLYIEHTFAFRFNPNIGRDCSPLTADDIRELDAYYTARRIELVPSIASFGHMGFVLSLPEYRHLAEVEATKPWSQMTWAERMRGLTLDPRNPESQALIENMYGELLPLFSGGWVNVSGDETYDLGKGKNRLVPVGELYVGHVQWLRGLCERYGKRIMVWGDVLLKHPAMIDQVPKDVVILNWLYAPDADFDSTERFVRAGLSTHVCSTTMAWDRILHDIDLAEENIRRNAAAGLRCGAEGFLNTEWGDQGHFNVPAGAWHGIDLGAVLSWNGAGPSIEDFDREFSKRTFGDPAAAGVAALRRTAAAARKLRTWRALHAPLAEVVPPDQFRDDECDRLRQEALMAAAIFADYHFTGDAWRQDAAELEIACQMNALLTDKLRMVRGEHNAFGIACEMAARKYEGAWLARHRRSNLDDILAVFRRLAEEARSA